MVQATDSQIAMWRGAIALAWANGAMDEGEKSQLLEFFKDNIYLTDSQRAVLTKDMEHKIEFKDAWDAITDLQDRTHPIDIAPTLFSSRGTPTLEEKALYNTMFAHQMAHVDTQKLQDEIAALKAYIPIEKREIEREYEQDYSNPGPVGRMIYHFNKILCEVP